MEELEENYEESLKFLRSLQTAQAVGNLEKVKTVLHCFGNPEKKINFVHIAGTNGKGSTTMMLSTIYKKAGYKVGTYISPDVVDFRERIQYDGNFIEKEEVCAIVESIRKIVIEKKLALTYFECMTVIAFIYFEKKKCDIIFLEVGLGGRLDATNVIEKSLLSIITKIDYDHMQLLGNTLEEIAQEKCGIIKEKGNVLLYPVQEKEVIQLVKRESKKREAIFFMPNVEELRLLEKNIFHMEIQYKGENYVIGLHGMYQIYNSITVIEAVKILQNLGYPVKKEEVYAGIRNTVFPGRWEMVEQNPLTILDGAHNVSGIKALVENIEQIQNSPKIAIVSILKDKQMEKMCQIFASHFDRILVVPIENERNTEPIIIKEKIKKYQEKVECIDSYEEAIKTAKGYAKKEGIILIFGSLYLASQIRKQFYK